MFQSRNQHQQHTWSQKKRHSNPQGTNKPAEIILHKIPCTLRSTSRTLAAVFVFIQHNLPHVLSLAKEHHDHQFLDIRPLGRCYWRALAFGRPGVGQTKLAVQVATYSFLSVVSKIRWLLLINTLRKPSITLLLQSCLQYNQSIAAPKTLS
jgi:hypothetical protein